jgi:hypothetical protein
MIIGLAIYMIAKVLHGANRVALGSAVPVAGVGRADFFTKPQGITVTNSVILGLSNREMQSS